MALAQRVRANKRDNLAVGEAHAVEHVADVRRALPVTPKVTPPVAFVILARRPHLGSVGETAVFGARVTARRVRAAGLPRHDVAAHRLDGGLDTRGG